MNRRIGKIIILCLLLISISSCNLIAQNPQATIALGEKSRIESDAVSIPTDIEAQPISSPSPTDSQTTLRRTPSSPMGELDSKTWSVFPEAATLNQCRVTYITQTTDSVMWFGCGLGVTSFDGFQWRTYTSDDTFGNSRITAISPDPRQGLWLGTEINGLYRFDGELWHHVSEKEHLIDSEVTAITVSNEGVLWVGTRSGLFTFEDNQWHSNNFAELYNNTYITNIAVTSNNTIWAGLETGRLVYFDGVEWREKHVGGIGSKIVSLSPSSDNSLWLIKGKDIIQIFGNQDFIYPSDAFNYSPPMTITVTRDGSVWIGTWVGYKIALLQGKKWKTINGEDILEYSSTTEHSLPFNGVFAIYEDNTGALWFGTVRGAYKFEQFR